MRGGGDGRAKVTPRRPGAGLSPQLGQFQREARQYVLAAPGLVEARHFGHDDAGAIDPGRFDGGLMSAGLEQGNLGTKEEPR